MTESPSAGDHQSGELGGSRGAGEATPDFGVAESELEVGPSFFRVLSAGARPAPFLAAAFASSASAAVSAVSS